MSTNNIASSRKGSATIELEGDAGIVVTRLFDAPAALIYKAWTTPELVRRWWGFETSEWLVCEVDLREGGQWRYVIKDEGQEVGFHGTFKEIADPERLVNTEVYEGIPESPVGDWGPGTLNTLTLEESAGVTTLTQHIDCGTSEVRDMILQSGMEVGMQTGFDRIEDLVKELRS
jgi:uncharacterized protein YndB with AHSA1/START domain